MLILLTLNHKEEVCMYHENETHGKIKGTYDVRSSVFELYPSK